MRKDPGEITFLGIYWAVSVTEESHLFRLHENPNIHCPVGRNIERVLQAELKDARFVMEQRLAQTPLDQPTKIK